MFANAKRHWPPALSPTQSEAVPTWPAYSDRTSALMAHFCELAHDTFVADQAPPEDHAGAPTVPGEAGRNELKRRLEAGGFRLVKVFNKDQSLPSSSGRVFCGSYVSRHQGEGVAGH